MTTKTDGRSARGAKTAKGKGARGGGDGDTLTALIDEIRKLGPGTQKELLSITRKYGSRVPPPPDAETAEDGGRSIDELLYKSELKDIEDNVLPFDIHTHYALSPTWNDDGGERDMRQYEWSPAEAAVADAALLRGFRLSVPVRPDCIAWATCEIVRRLKSPVHVWYTSRHERLILGVMEDDQIAEEETDNDQA